MKDWLKIWQWLGFAVTACGGTILHFLYDWLDGAVWIAPFSGVNESTWEHMKLLYWPLILFALVQFPYFKGKTCYWWIKLLETLTGLILIPILFYTYNGVFGKSPDWVNVAIFYVTTAAVFLLEWWLLKRESMLCKWSWFPFAIICLIGILFVIFTFSPPHIPLFKDPVSGNYGI